MSNLAVLSQDPADTARYKVHVNLREEELATFSGPDALLRAIHFASTYYDIWADPTDLAQNGRI